VLDDTVLFDRACIDLPPHQRRVGYVFQDARLFPHLSVRQNLTLRPLRIAAPAGEGRLDRIVGCWVSALFWTAAPPRCRAARKARRHRPRAVVGRRACC
jgi:molybdate transport system ATP-binding protein